MARHKCCMWNWTRQKFYWELTFNNRCYENVNMRSKSRITVISSTHIKCQGGIWPTLGLGYVQHWTWYEGKNWGVLITELISVQWWCLYKAFIFHSIPFMSRMTLLILINCVYSMCVCVYKLISNIKEPFLQQCSTFEFQHKQLPAVALRLYMCIIKYCRDSNLSRHL